MTNDHSQVEAVKKATRVLNQTLNELKFKQHPD